MSKTAIILIGVVVLISIALFFNNFSITGYQVASTTTGSVCSTPENRVGIGTTTPSVNLEVVQNGAIKVGRALLSSGGDYAHLANNEYYTGSAWVGTAPGALIQLTGQQINFFRHDGRGGHSHSMSIHPNGNILAAGNVGIGIGAPTVNLEVVQNGAIKIGQAYLSSGGDYAHLANNEYYTGSAWVGTAPGALIQLAGQQINFFRHDGRGGHTASMSITPGRVDITGSLWVNGRQIA